MYVKATPHLHDILIVHLFNAGLPCMASARALDTTRPVASVTRYHVKLSTQLQTYHAGPTSYSYNSEVPMG